MSRLVRRTYPGWILGSEKLVSCPVDWYSTVEVETGKPRNDERPLSRAMVDQLLAHWGYPAALSQQIRITLHSTIGSQRDGQQHRRYRRHRGGHRPSSGPRAG